MRWMMDDLTMCPNCSTITKTRELIWGSWCEKCIYKWLEKLDFSCEKKEE